MRWAGLVARVGRGESYTGFWLENPGERDHLGEPGVDGRIILKWIFRNLDVGEWTGSSLFGIGTGVGHVGMRCGTFGFHKMRGIS
jgi:hypothetical protein